MVFHFCANLFSHKIQIAGDFLQQTRLIEALLAASSISELFSTAAFAAANVGKSDLVTFEERKRMCNKIGYPCLTRINDQEVFDGLRMLRQAV
jgi:hypothetical protein